MDRRILLLVAVVAAGSLALGTGGFTSASIERGVSISVADDPQDAFLGLRGDGIDRCGQQQLYRVKNQFSGDIVLTDVSARVVSAHGVRASITDTPDRLVPGESGNIRILVKPGPPESDEEPGSVTVRIEASGSGTDVLLDRTVEAYCAKSQPEQSGQPTPTPTSTPTPTQTATPTSS